jgi:hypothetical protein
MSILQKKKILFFLALLLSLPFSVSAQISAQTEQPPVKAPIRAITAFVNLDRSRYQIQIAETVEFLKFARTKFESRGYTVQTLRMATQPFPEYTQGMSHDETIRFFKSLDAAAEQEKILISIGPAYLAAGDGDAQAQLLADILKNTKSLFGSVMVTDAHKVNLVAVRAAARVIKSLEDTEHSEGNFRFAALASVPPYSPFFPAAYHTGNGRQFTIGLQSAGTVKAAFESAPDTATARRRLIDLRGGKCGVEYRPGAGVDLFGAGSFAGAIEGRVDRRSHRNAFETAVRSERHDDGGGDDHFCVEGRYCSAKGWLFGINAADRRGSAAGGPMEQRVCVD